MMLSIDLTQETSSRLSLWRIQKNYKMKKKKRNKKLNQAIVQITTFNLC